MPENLLSRQRSYQRHIARRHRQSRLRQTHRLFAAHCYFTLYRWSLLIGAVMTLTIAKIRLIQDKPPHRSPLHFTAD